MHLYDSHSRHQLARERAGELARDWRRAQKAAEREPWQTERAEHAGLVSLFRRRRRRRLAEAAAAHRP
jgi:cbb3-type cytochrome oxidase subunit 3